MGVAAKGKKIGRNKDWCRRYRDMGTREDNKMRRISKHLEKHPNDVTAQGAYRMLGGKL